MIWRGFLCLFKQQRIKMSLKLLDGVTTDTVGEYIRSNGFQGVLRIAGDLDSGTVTIEIEGQDGSALDIQDAAQNPINSFIKAGVISSFSIPQGLRVRASLSGSTSPTVFVYLD